MALVVTELLEVMIVEKAVVVAVAEAMAATATAMVVLVVVVVAVTEAPMVTSEARAVVAAQWCGQQQLRCEQSGGQSTCEERRR